MNAILQAYCAAQGLMIDDRIRAEKKELGPVNDIAPRPVNGTLSQPVNGTLSRPVNGTISQPVKSTLPQPINDTLPGPVNGAVRDPVNGTLPIPLVTPLVTPPVSSLPSNPDRAIGLYQHGALPGTRDLVGSQRFADAPSPRAPPVNRVGNRGERRGGEYRYVHAQMEW